MAPLREAVFRGVDAMDCHLVEAIGPQAAIHVYGTIWCVAGAEVDGVGFGSCVATVAICRGCCALVVSCCCWCECCVSREQLLLLLFSVAVDVVTFG